MSDNTNNDIAPLAPEVSPLLEADPSSVNEFIAHRLNDIFNKPPLTLSDDDLKVAVDYYRRERARFQIESMSKPPRAAKGTVTPKAKKAAPKSVAEALASTLDLLDD
jgi:hypothetical protein